MTGTMIAGFHRNAEFAGSAPHFALNGQSAKCLSDILRARAQSVRTPLGGIRIPSPGVSGGVHLIQRPARPGCVGHFPRQACPQA